MLCVRLALVATLPDVDTDAYGHFRIARALVRDPTNLAAHWVWLPGYHYLLWAWIHLGVGFAGARVLSALAQAAGPFLLFDFVARRGGDRAGRVGVDPGAPAADRQVAFLAALLWTVAPLANRLATSAQAETWFTLFVLSAAWAVERRRSWLAGAALAAACLVRYEAWGAVPALALLCWKRRSPGAPAILLPAAAIAAWIVLRRYADGEWLTFLWGTRRFADGWRAAQGRSALVDGLLIPLGLPPLVMGPAIVLLPLGIRRSIRAGWAVPAGVLAFLALSYLGRSAIGLERYLTALTPFVCVAVADGARTLPNRLPQVSARGAARGALAAMAVTTVVHLGWVAHRAREREGELRRYEAETQSS
jgi:hypothetical protein